MGDATRYFAAGKWREAGPGAEAAQPVGRRYKGHSYARTVRRERDPAAEMMLRRELHRHQGGLCGICAMKVEMQRWIHLDREEMASTDHVIPLTARGTFGPGNVVCAHRGCNEAKADRMPTGCELIWLLAVNARMGVHPVRW